MRKTVTFPLVRRGGIRLLPLLLPALLCAAPFFTVDLVLPRPAAALAVSKGLPFYARDMEYYYQERRPETVPGILRTFDAQGVLADGQKQLMLAAFLAEALRQDASLRQRVLPPERSLSRDGRRTLAWAVHLAGLADGPALLDTLLDNRDALLLRQIRQSPTPLSRWDIYSEKTVLQMYWAAYFASGDPACLDAIIEAALRYARLNASGRQNDPAFSVSAAAAASLYELAPRHPAVQTRLRATLQELTGAEAETLRTILRQP